MAGEADSVEYAGMTNAASSPAEVPELVALTPAQRTLADLWPQFQASTGVPWGLDQLVWFFSAHARALRDLPDDEAAELATMLRRAITRFSTMARLAALTVPPPSRGQA